MKECVCLFLLLFGCSTAAPTITMRSGDAHTVKAVAYTPFGTPTSSLFAYGFTGQENQGASQDYNARSFVPALARFTQIDNDVRASVFPGISVYTYVKNNPLNAIDPDGGQDKMVFSPLGKKIIAPRRAQVPSTNPTTFLVSKPNGQNPFIFSVMQYTKYTSSEENRKYYSEILKKAGQLYLVQNNPWYDPKRKGFGFNCHTFSMADVLGLSEKDWLASKLEIIGDEVLEEIGGVGDILGNFYKKEGTFASGSLMKGIADKVKLLENDMIMFTSGEGNKRRFIHSGLLTKRGDTWWIMSKVGDIDGIWVVPLDTLQNVFDKQFDTISIYRPL